MALQNAAQSTFIYKYVIKWQRYYFFSELFTTYSPKDLQQLKSMLTSQGEHLSEG